MRESGQLPRHSPGICGVGGREGNINFLSSLSQRRVEERGEKKREEYPAGVFGGEKRKGRGDVMRVLSTT